MKYKFKTRPYRHQVRYLKRAVREQAHGCLWEPGTGKTKFIVDWASIIWTLKRIERVLIVCPLSVVGVWEEEFEIHAPIKFDIQILDKDDIDIPRFRKTRLQILVVNYDLVWRRKKLIKRFDPQFVVADESHRIKKPSARRSSYMRTWRHAPYRAILTGTPAPKSYLDLYSQWVFLNSKRFGTEIALFKDRYIVFGGFMRKEVKGYNHIKELRRKIRADASVVLKRKALDLPEQVYQRVPVYLEPKAQQRYDKMAYEMFLELKNGEVSDAKNVAVKILRLQQIAGGFIKSDEGTLYRMSLAKNRACNDLLEDLWESDEKVIVFARFLAEVRDVTIMAKQAGVPYYVLKGKVPREVRTERRKKFQRLPGPSLFVAQIQTGGLGISLHTANQVVFYSVTYALDDYIQACDRVHRIGQKHKVTYRHLIARGTIDERIYASLRAKGDVMRSIMEDPKRLLTGRTNGGII